jgi:2,3-bisphosphoglycerate-independent phosphoglycerate mutase
MKKALLMILDGWGIGKHDKADVIFNGKTPYLDQLFKEYPHSQLRTDGENVGLPGGQMGNSEVGHMNIGAGRIIYQDLVKINKDIRENTISQNPVIGEAFSYAKKENRAVHFIGLVSDGGVHSSDLHLYKLCDLTKEFGLEKVYIHAITDGRDTDPKSGLGFVRNLQNHLKTTNAKIASLVGRYYTMDRDKRWERVKVGYDLMVNGLGEKSKNVLDAIQASYDNQITDEFIKPIVVMDNNESPIGKIQENDVVFCFNYRSDRVREITTVLSQTDMPEFGMKAMPLHYLTMTPYDDKFKNVHIVYDKDNVQNTLGETLAKAGKKQLRIAETEKFAHVTFFFSGGREDTYEGEERILIPSPKVATYDLQPEMSAFLVADALTAQLKEQKFDFVCLNFANGDMVGHTGIYEAILKAVNTIDQCVEKVVETAKANDYSVVIIADHGNADNAVNADGSPNTAHSMNPVPCILVDKRYSKIENGILADVAPTILKIMGLDIPKEMTGKILI